MITVAVFACFVANNPIYSAQHSSIKTLWRGPKTERWVALTFDDGPKAEESTLLLNLLDAYGVRATFFVTGRESFSNQDLLKRISDADHDIGNHTYNHANLTKISKKDIENEITKTNDIIFQITGKKTRFFRPPGGQINGRVSNVVGKLGMQIVLYDVNTVDYSGGEKDAPTLNVLLSEVQPGSIILLHNGGANTIKNLPLLLEGLQKRGYHCVRLSDMLNLNNESPSRHHRPL